MIDTLRRMAGCKRMWQHTPVGLSVAILIRFNGVAGFSAWVGFLVYEVWQCRNIGDNSEQDILGGLVGLIATGLIMGVLGLW